MSTHILIIEDDDILRAFLTLHLEDADFRVTATGSGEEGLKLFEAGDFGLILADLTLPDLDGLEVVERIRRTGFQAPILILTARKSEIDRLVGLGTGANGYLTKPVEPEDLIARVRELLDPDSPDSSEPASIF